jgi:hypothetical protein
MSHLLAISRILFIAALTIEYDIYYFDVSKYISITPVIMATLGCFVPIVFKLIPAKRYSILIGLLIAYNAIKFLNLFAGYNYVLIDFQILAAMCIVSQLIDITYDEFQHTHYTII